jgi:hypothetical protein
VRLAGPPSPNVVRLVTERGARHSIGGWLRFYNEERLHQALGYRTPRAVFDGEAHES